MFFKVFLNEKYFFNSLISSNGTFTFDIQIEEAF